LQARTPSSRKRIDDGTGITTIAAGIVIGIIAGTGISGPGSISTLGRAAIIAITGGIAIGR
jgi:hypothetical protein